MYWMMYHYVATVPCYPVQAYSRGRLVYDDGEFVGEKGWGKLIKCSL